MDRSARKALSVIRDCVAAGRYALLGHFVERMDSRGLVWPDILAVLDRPTNVRDAGPERFDRPKWIVSGTTADGIGIEMVCVLDKDDAGNQTLFITIY